ncbi:MAG: hypothetical protein AAFX08_05800 [Pseudomonadota bacterium]
MLNRKQNARRAREICAGSLAAVIALAVQAANAETRWRVETAKQDGSTETSEIWASASNIKMTVSDGGENVEVMLLGASDELVVIDHDNRSYFVIKMADMAATTAAVREQIEAADINMGAVQEQMRAAMADAMANLSPDERAAAESAMANLPGMGAGAGFPGIAKAPVYEIARAKGSVNVMGTSAAKYQITQDGAPDGEIWAVKTSEVEGGAVMRDRMRDLFGRMEKAMGGFATAGARGPFQYLDQLDGRVPVGGSEPDGPDGPTTTRLVAAADMSPPPGLWTPPEDYRREDAPF